MEDSFETRGPYLLVQRDFEWAGDDLCYIESDDEACMGRFAVRIIEFSRARLEVELTGDVRKRVVVTYELSEREFVAVQRIGLIVFGVTDPEPPGEDAL